MDLAFITKANTKNMSFMVKAKTKDFCSPHMSRQKPRTLYHQGLF